MRLVHVGVSAVSVKVGDFAGNAARLVEVIDRSTKRFDMLGFFEQVSTAKIDPLHLLQQATDVFFEMLDRP